MHDNRIKKWLPATPGLVIGHANAAPLEGEIGINAALLLMLLGVWAIIMGLRNLQALRHKHLVPERHTAERDPQPPPTSAHR
jgi:hypothetical protein